jgi:hypothetical protein
LVAVVIVETTLEGEVCWDLSSEAYWDLSWEEEGEDY